MYSSVTSERHPELSSKIFRMDNKTLARHLILLYGMTWIGITALMSFPALMAGIFADMRWLLIFFMIVCLLIPMLTAFLYFYHGLRSSTVLNVVHHRLNFCKDGIRVELFDTKTDDASSRTEYIYRSEQFFPFESLKRFISGSGSITIPVVSPTNGFLWIPASSFPDAETFKEVIRILTIKTPNPDNNENTEKFQ